MARADYGREAPRRGARHCNLIESASGKMVSGLVDSPAVARVLIMVWVFGPAAYKCVARVFVHLPAASPRRRHPDHSKCAVVLGALKDEPSVGANAPILECVRDVALSVWCKSRPWEVTSHVAEGNCVAAMRGGEQPEANEQPAG